MRSRWLPWLAALALSACATTSDGLRADTAEPVLLAHSGAFELHVRAGKVVQVIPAAGGVKVRPVSDEGELRPAIDSVFPLSEARAAFERLAAPGKRGKVVLRVVEPGSG